MAVMAVLVLPLAAGHSICEKPEKIIGSGPDNWWPFGYRVGNVTEGIGTYAQEETAKEMGIPFESKYLGSWDVTLDKSKAGKEVQVIDCYKTEERDWFIFADQPFAYDPITAYSLNGSSFAFASVEELGDYTGIGTPGDSYGQEIDDLISSGKIKLIIVNNATVAYQYLREGKADYFLYSAWAGRKAMVDNDCAGEFNESGVIYWQPFYLGVSRNSGLACSMDDFNAAMDKVIKSGRINDKLKEAAREAGLSEDMVIAGPEDIANTV